MSVTPPGDAADQTLLGEEGTARPHASIPFAQIVHSNPALALDWDLKTSPFLTLGGTATLDFGSKKVSFVVKAIETRGANHYVITGRSEGNPNPAKDVIVTYKNGAMFANAYLPEGTYAIMPSYKAKGEWLVGKVEATPVCGSCPQAPAPKLTNSPSPESRPLATSTTSATTTTTMSPPAQAMMNPIAGTPEAQTANAVTDTSRIVTTDGPVVDVLLYLDQDLVDLLGTDATSALVDLCGATFNTTAENSLMKTRLRISKTKTMTAPWKTLNKTTGEPVRINFDAMQVKNGGFENIASDTSLAGADIAFFLGAHSDNNTFSGWGSGLYSFDAHGNAIACNGTSGASQYYTNTGKTFAHEVGHMLGCNHERSLYTPTYGQTKFTNSVRDYNFAWSNLSGRDEAFHVSTLMSGIGAGLLYFSNPNVQYVENWNTYLNEIPTPHSLTHQMGRPIGTADAAYDAKYIEEATAPFASKINPSLVPAYGAGHFIGLSTRGIIGNADSAMIGGFIIEGSTPKKCMVRALGPSLALDGVTGVATNPKLALSAYQNQQWHEVAQNDDWVNASNQAELGASDYKPRSFVEPGLVITLNPGPYSAVIQPQDGMQGVGMVEVYEMPDNGNAQMVDVATRALVGTQNNALFGGFIIDCPAGQKKSVLLRGIGPSLTAQGVSNALQDPVIKVYDMNVSPAVLIAQSDDWATEATAPRVANQPYVPGSPREAATVIDLPAGVYSVVMEPKNGVQGVGMIEVYQMADSTPAPLHALPAGTQSPY